MLNKYVNRETFDRAKQAAAERLKEGRAVAEGLYESQFGAEELKVYKLYPEAHMPTYGSDWAACFDLHASITVGAPINYFMTNNKKGVHYVQDTGIMPVYPGHRALIPTGLVFDLDEDQSIRVHPRSGLAVKQGIMLANCEGVIDADYVQQTYITVFNTSDVPFEITDGMRLAQAEVVRNNRVRFVEVDDEPGDKTNRSGGFGSTGS
jgi:dUTP pyrophosphatase